MTTLLDLSPRRTFANLSPAQRIEAALAEAEGMLTNRGSLTVVTGKHTGRMPEDKFFVREPSTESTIWWGPINRAIDPPVFDRILARIRAHFHGKDLHVQDAYACADPTHRLSVRVVCEKAWHALFADRLFRRFTSEELLQHTPDWHVLHAPELLLDPPRDGTRSDAAIVVSFERKLVLIAGTHYAGEIKKSIFSVLNYLLPDSGVFPMHCAANLGPEGDSALFFGLSGTGKTTLSADPARRLIGDDEHGWSDSGVFNLEGGCYAKTIRLSQEGEPMIYDALHFGSVLENVPVDPNTRQPDLMSSRLTENTRAAYPLDFIPNHEPSGRGGHPKNIFFLTCDAFGVLPPIARLTPEQAMYHFLSGYTAKVAGTEEGITEPKVAFSTCFGAPFMPRHPMRYAEMLRDRMREHGCPVWLVNTGWTGGPYGIGDRIKLRHTRALLAAALGHQLDEVPCQTDPVFGIAVPRSCPDVPERILRPRETWSDPNAYDVKARELAGLFRKNFEQYTDEAGEAVRDAGPRL